MQFWPDALLDWGFSGQKQAISLQVMASSGEEPAEESFLEIVGNMKRTIKESGANTVYSKDMPSLVAKGRAGKDSPPPAGCQPQSYYLARNFLSFLGCRKVPS